MILLPQLSPVLGLQGCAPTPSEESCLEFSCLSSPLCWNYRGAPPHPTKEAIWNPPASTLRCAGTTCVLFSASRIFSTAVGYRLAHASYLFPLQNLSNNAALMNFTLSVMVTQVGRWKGSPTTTCPPPNEAPLSKTQDFALGSIFRGVSLDPSSGL